MRSFRISRTGGIALAVIGALLCAQAGFASGITLRYGGKAGDQAVYQMVMEGNTTVFVSDREQKTSLTTEMFVTQKVLDVEQDGAIKIMTRIDSGSLNINGTTTVIPNLRQQVVTAMQPNGKILRTEGFTQNLNLNNMQLVFPEGPVAIGHKWSHTIEPSLQVPVPLAVEYRILKTEKIKGFDCVKIASEVRSGQKSTIEGLSLDVSADGTIYFAYKEGRMIKNEVKSKMRMILKRVVDNRQQSIVTKMEMNMKMEHQY